MAPHFSLKYLRAIALLVVASLVLTLGACSSSTDTDRRAGWPDRLNDILRLNPSEADRALKKMAADAPSTHQARQIEFERARLARRHGDFEHAKRLFEALWDDDPTDAAASRARYELARILWDVDGDESAARALLEEAIIDTPPWAGADFALSYLLRKERQNPRPEALVELLEDYAERTDDGPMAAKLYLERAQLLAAPLRRPNEALSAFRLAHAQCGDCASANEALYQMGQLYETYQRWQPALAAYAIVADRSDTSSFVGTYASHRAADARYRMGFVNMLFLRDYDAATDHFQTYTRRFSNHRYTDDSAWHLVQIKRLRGDHQGYQQALQDFVDDYPFSPYLDDAHRRLAEAL